MYLFPMLFGKTFLVGYPWGIQHAKGPLTKVSENIEHLISLNSILLPEYLLGVTLLYSILLSTWITRNSFNLMIQKTFSEIFGLAMLLVCFLYYNNILYSYSFCDCSIGLTSSTNSSFYKSILNGELALIAKFIIGFISAVYFFISAYTLTEQKLTSPEYSTLIAFSMLGLLLACSGNDLLTIYLAIELISLASYALASFKKTHCSSESGLKYFIVGSISSSFFLLGGSILYLETGSIYLGDFTRLFFFTSNHIPESINLNLVDIALLFIFLSLFIKLACAPFHLWALNVYEESPTSSSFYFAAVTKLSLIIVIIKLAFYTFFKLCFCWVSFFTIVGITSAFIGAIGGIRQKKFKTLLAYSSTSNIGYALIVVGGLTDTAAWAILFHIVVYQFTSLCTWALLLVTKLKLKLKTWKYNKEIADFSLLKNGNLLVGFSFAATLFSLAGVPPLLGFEPKLFVLTDVIKSQYYLPGVIFVFCSLIAAFYYIRVVKTFFFENLPTGNLYYPINTSYSIALGALIHSLFYCFNDTAFLTHAFKSNPMRMRYSVLDNCTEEAIYYERRFSYCLLNSDIMGVVNFFQETYWAPHYEYWFYAQVRNLTLEKKEALDYLKMLVKLKRITTELNMQTQLGLIDSAIMEQIFLIQDLQFRLSGYVNIIQGSMSTEGCVECKLKEKDSISEVKEPELL